MKAIFAALLILAAFSQALTFTEDEVAQLDVNDIKEFLRGIFDAWKSNQEEVEELLKCLEKFTDIETEIGVIIQKLKKIDPRDIRKVIAVVVEIIECTQKIFGDVKFCFRSGSEIWKIVSRLLKMSPIEIFIKIMGNIHVNGEILWNDIVEIIHAIKEGNCYKLGHCLGELMELMIFKAKPLNF